MVSLSSSATLVFSLVATTGFTFINAAVPTGYPTSMPSVLSSGCISVSFPFRGQDIPFGPVFDDLLAIAMNDALPSFNFSYAFTRNSGGATCPTKQTVKYTGVTYNKDVLTFDLKIAEGRFNRGTSYEAILMSSIKNAITSGTFGKKMALAAPNVPGTTAGLSNDAAIQAYSAIQQSPVTLEVLTATMTPSSRPSSAPFVLMRDASDLSAADSGGVIGAVAAFGAVLLFTIGYMLYKGSGEHSAAHPPAETPDHK